MFVDNIWAVLVAALINMVIGAVWYSPALYAKAWMKETGRKDMNGAGSPATGYAVSVVASLVIAVVMSVLVSAVGAHAFWEGAYLGLLVWVGFVATTAAANYTFEGRSRTLYAINVGYSLVSFLVMGGVLAVWR